MTVSSVLIDLSNPLKIYESSSINSLTVDCDSITIVATGNLYITSTPPGATIFIDGIEQTGHLTPATLTGIAEGPHDIIIRMEGYNDYLIENFVVIADQTTSTPEATLTPAEGCIYFNSDPPGALIYIDDILQTENTTPALICGLTLGRHTYRLSLEGYMDISGDFTLGEGEGQITTDTFSPIVQAGFGGAAAFLMTGLLSMFLLAKK